MRISSLLRSATLALSLFAATGLMVSAFASDAHAAQQQQQQQATNAAPYDGPDFVVPESNLSY